MTVLALWMELPRAHWAFYATSKHCSAQKLLRVLVAWRTANMLCVFSFEEGTDICTSATCWLANRFYHAAYRFSSAASYWQHYSSAVASKPPPSCHPWWFVLLAVGGHSSLLVVGGLVDLPPPADLQPSWRRRAATTHPGQPITPSSPDPRTGHSDGRDRTLPPQHRRTDKIPTGGHGRTCLPGVGVVTALPTCRRDHPFPFIGRDGITCHPLLAAGETADDGLVNLPCRLVVPLPPCEPGRFPLPCW